MPNIRSVKKIIISLFVMILLLTTYLTFPVLAASKYNINDAELSADYENLRKEVKIMFTKKQYEELPVAIKQGLYKVGLVSDNISNIAINPMLVTSSGYISGYNSFARYVDVNFKQGSTGKSCMPIAVANVLSYFKYRGFTKLISGNTLTQAEFDQICTDTKWNNTGTTIGNGLNGYTTYVTRKGYRANTVPILTHITNIKEAINGNIPIFATEYSSVGNHVYTVVGYKIDGGTEYLYTYTGLNALPIAWIPRSAITSLTGLICLN